MGLTAKFNPEIADLQYTKPHTPKALRIYRAQKHGLVMDFPY